MAMLQNQRSPLARKDHTVDHQKGLANRTEFSYNLRLF
jgi:hypothetical protein